jgi:hypothetical protein
MKPTWKTNWNISREHYIGWWKKESLVLSIWDLLKSMDPTDKDVDKPGESTSLRENYINHEFRAASNHYNLAHSSFPADILPIAQTNIGPGSLCLFLGCEPDFNVDDIWYNSCWQNISDPEILSPITFNDLNPWWIITENILQTSVNKSKGKYMVGCPDLVENIDILCSLRGPQSVMMDMIERPDWVFQKVSEINQVYFEVYERIYDLIKLDDDSSCFGPFRIWGPGKTAKVQCDASAMFSPQMFRQFVVPSLREQCQWLDHSLYHLDGTQAICHLDTLLEIEELNAIEWTPQAGIENGGNSRWYPMYSKILEAGKALQVIKVEPDEILPLLDSIGGDGVFIHANFKNESEIETSLKLIEQFR